VIGLASLISDLLHFRQPERDHRQKAAKSSKFVNTCWWSMKMQMTTEIKSVISCHH
jgi:hypothetical protein